MISLYFRVLFVAIPFLIIIGSCRHQVDAPLNPGSGNGGTGSGGGSGSSATLCDTTKIYFQQQILPVLLSNCAMSGCHDDASHQEGVVLTSYEKVMSTAGIRAGRPDNSELFERITETDPGKRMPRPPQNPLSQDQVQRIRKWIEQGALNLSCQNQCDTSMVTYTTSIKIIIANKCQGCHSGAMPQGGIDLSTYAGLKAKITDGRLWGAVNHQPGFSPMPKNGAKLSDCEITQLRKWINGGSPNN